MNKDETMWEKSKRIVEKIDEADCMSENKLRHIEIATRLLDAITYREEIMPELEQNMLEEIKASKCLTDSEFEDLKTALLIVGIYDDLLNASTLDCDKENVFALQHAIKSRKE